MRHLHRKSILTVAAIGLFFSLFGPAATASAQTEELDALFEELLDPNAEDWKEVEDRIWKFWSESGSDSMDLLLERARKAMEQGDPGKAIEHLTALTDHAPDFAEGWNARATAFFMLERYGMSMADIHVVLDLNPRHFGALSGLGMIYEILDQPDLAMKAYQAALAVHPHRPDIQEAIERLKETTMGTSL